jgi:hypothetical protein
MERHWNSVSLFAVGTLAACTTLAPAAPAPARQEIRAPQLRVVVPGELFVNQAGADPGASPWNSGTHLDGSSAQDPPKQEPAQDEPRNERKAGDRTGFAGLGFTDGPDSFLLGLELDFWQSDRLAIGPMVQLGLDDDMEMIAPSFHAKYRFPLEASRLAVFAQGGVGFLWLERDPIPGDDDDLGFMLQVGGGVDWQLEAGTFLGSSILVDLMPDEVLGENAIFTWQVVQLGVRF